MDIVRITTSNRTQINDFIRSHWLTTEMIIRGKVIDMTKVDGLVLLDGEEIIGLVTFMIYGDTMELTSLDSLYENQGHGSMLLEGIVKIAQEQGLRRIILITTNDNINAIRFYQKRGYDMTRLYHNALDQARKLKPEIPLIGDNGIPLRHEIEFEKIL